MEIVTPDPAPATSRADAVRLLHEMAAVVRTIFAVDAAATPAPAPAPAATPAPPPAPVPAPPAPGVPASIPVPGLALLHEIAFLDD